MTDQHRFAYADHFDHSFSPFVRALVGCKRRVGSEEGRHMPREGLVKLE
jgi:hypothetical protein